VARLEGEKGKGAVHGPGVDVNVAEVLGDETSDGAFARGGRSIDTNDGMKHELAAEFLNQGDLFGEAGITGFDTGSVFDHSFPFCKEAQDCGGHSDAVVPVTFHFGAHELASAFNEEAIGLFFNGDPKEAEVFCHNREAVTLFVAEFGRVSNFGCALGEGGGHGENGNFIDQVGDFLSGDRGGFKRFSAGNCDSAERFGGGLFYLFQNARAHAQEGGDEGGAGGVEADASESELGTTKASGEDHPKSGRGEVARNIQFGGFEALGAVKNEGSIFGAKAGPKGGEKSFGMVARQGGLGESGFSAGLEGGEENAGFDLSAGNLAGEVDRSELGATDGERGSVATSFAEDFGAELAEGLGDSAHGAAGEGGIAEEAGGEGKPGDDSREEAHGGAAVAAIDGFGGGEEFSSPALD